MPAEPRLASINRQQLVLRSINVEQLIDEDHSARLIWQLIGRLDLSLYHAQIEAAEGRAGREHTAPQLLISLWIYAYSRDVSFGARVGAAVRIRTGLPVALRPKKSHLSSQASEEILCSVRELSS